MDAGIENSKVFSLSLWESVGVRTYLRHASHPSPNPSQREGKKPAITQVRSY
ncbi:MAG: hypothetical protein QOG23_2918 [Blastocatellia bacterium]|jgi:hypothetical protein|nr:hypothetical protein [Blastocatellia bacterium]